MIRRRPLATLPMLLAALGVGLTGYYGQQWLEREEYSEADIAASVELNLQMDLQRRGSHLQPDAERVQQLREQIRAEVVADIRREEEKIQLRFGVGLIALVVALGHFVFARLTAQGVRPS